MNSLIHDQSERVNTTELSLWDIPPTACAIASRKVSDCVLVNGLTPGGAFEFRHNFQRSFLDLNRSRLYVKLTIRDADGAAVDINDTDKQVSFINFVGQTLFSKLQLYIGGKLVEESGSTVPHSYRAFVETELFTDILTKSALGIAGYTQDTNPDGVNAARTKLAKGSKGCEFIAPISLSLFQQKRLLLNFIDFKLVAHLHDAPFVLETFHATSTVTTYKFTVDDIKLRLHEVELVDSALLAIENKLRTTPIRYPINSVQMRNFYIPTGSMSAPEHRLINSTCPKLVIVALVEEERYLGNLRKAPFKFSHANVNQAILTVAGKSIPARMTLDWSEKKSLEAYDQFQQALGIIHGGATNGVTRDMFNSTHTFFCYEVGNYLHSDAMSLLSLGTTSINISFKERTPNGFYAIVMSYFDDILEIDTNREVRLNSLV